MVLPTETGGEIRAKYTKRLIELETLEIEVKHVIWLCFVLIVVVFAYQVKI